MLDDLRLLFAQPALHRARVFARAVALLALSMAVLRFDPVEQPSNGGPLWIALAILGLAVAARTTAPTPAPAQQRAPRPLRNKPLMASQPAPVGAAPDQPRYMTPHELDLVTRNLAKPAQPAPRPPLRPMA